MAAVWSLSTKNDKNKSAMAVAMSLALWLVLDVLLVSCSSAYNVGRLGGADPSAEYLRQNSHILRHSGRGSSIDRRYGSNYFTSQTYRRGVYRGEIFWDGHAYGWTIPEDEDMPRICTNTKENRPDSNTTTLGYFICPMSHQAHQMEYCCGEIEEEYCCDSLTSKIFFYKERTTDDDLQDLSIVAIILAVIFLPFCICVACLAVCRNR